MAVIVITACSTVETDGYSIFFDDRIHLSDERVYYKGTVIGSVVSVENSNDNKAMAKIKIDSAHRYLIMDQATFYVDGGSLHYDSFKKFGNPLDNGARLLGFSSRGALKWFKTRTLFTRSAAVAAKQAAAISEGFI